MENATWMSFFSDGIGFMKTAEGALSRPEIFTPVIVYNISAMAIEKLFMAVLSREGVMPASNTLHDMALLAKSYIDIDAALENDLARMDRMQMICSFDDDRSQSFGEKDSSFFIDVMKRVNSEVIKVIHGGA